MTTPTYNIQQWSKEQKTRPNICGKWYVTCHGIDPDKPQQTMFLREDGTWQNVMTTDWLPNGGTFFNTENEAKIALALTGGTDHTESTTRKRGRHDTARGNS